MHDFRKRLTVYVPFEFECDPFLVSVRQVMHTLVHNLFNLYLLIHHILRPASKQLHTVFDHRPSSSVVLSTWASYFPLYSYSTRLSRIGLPAYSDTAVLGNLNTVLRNLVGIRTEMNPTQDNTTQQTPNIYRNLGRDSRNPLDQTTERCRLYRPRG